MPLRVEGRLQQEPLGHSQLGPNPTSGLTDMEDGASARFAERWDEI